jgi:predicted nuclease with TOPRIM domain
MTEAEALTASPAAKQQGIDDLSAALAISQYDELFSEYKRLEVRLAEASDRLSALKVENACLRWVVEQALGRK